MADFNINHITGKQGQQGTVLAGVTTVSSTGSMRIPSGPTEQRGGRGRGIFFGGDPADPGNMTLVEIATTGNGSDFGNLANNLVNCKGCASPTRGLIGGGGTPSVVSLIQGVTISSSGGVFNFGDLSLARNDTQCVANDVRGIICGGNTPATTTAKQNLIEFVTIASAGDASDFSDVSVPIQESSGASSPIRGIFVTGSPNSHDHLEALEFATLGNGRRFGDLTTPRNHNCSASNCHGGLG